jgi:hypothetical protein
VDCGANKFVYTILHGPLSMKESSAKYGAKSEQRASKASQLGRNVWCEHSLVFLLCPCLACTSAFIRDPSQCLHAVINFLAPVMAVFGREVD